MVQEGCRWEVHWYSWPDAEDYADAGNLVEAEEVEGLVEAEGAGGLVGAEKAEGLVGAEEAEDLVEFANLVEAGDSVYAWVSHL